MPDPLVSYAVSAGATVTAAAAVYTARCFRDVARTVHANEERSKQNRAILTGSAKHIEGVLPRLDDIEDARRN